MENDVDVSTLSEWFLAAEEATAEPRKNAERDADYYHGIQLTREEIQTLRKRGQPPVVINRIKRKVDYLTGLEKQQRTDPKAYPRNPNDEAAAEAATDALRYVADNTFLDAQRAQVWKSCLIEGIGIAQVIVDGPNEEIAIERVGYDRFFYDPHSVEPDFSDAKYLGVVVWQDQEDVIARYGEEHAAGLDELAQAERKHDTYDDKPKHAIWMDTKRKRVRVVQMWYEKRGQWHFCEFAGSVKFTGGVSPYLDEHGQPEHPFVCMSAYIDRDNSRYGVVREMIDPQDEINKRRSKALHLLTMRQVIAERGAVDDIAAARRELARPDGYIEKNPGTEFEIAATTDLAMGQTSLLQEAKAEIDQMGPNPSLAGKGDGDQSGRAILAQQQGGMIELGDLLDSLRQWDRRVFRMMWRRIRQFWQSERWIRVTDEGGAAQFLPLNVPMQDPFGGVQIHNPVAQMDVDIIIEDSPDVVTLQGEQFDQFMQLLPALAQLPPAYAKMAVEMAPNLRNKQKILELLEGGADPEQQAQAQAMQAMQAQMQMQGAQAELENKQADTMKKRADALKSVTQAAAEGAQAATPQIQ